MTWKNGTKYQGNWNLGKMHGHGVFTYANLNVYEGQFVNNMKHGIGTFTCKGG